MTKEEYEQKKMELNLKNTQIQEKIKNDNKDYNTIEEHSTLEKVLHGLNNFFASFIEHANKRL